jgi:hypothetical protein
MTSWLPLFIAAAALVAFFAGGNLGLTLAVLAGVSAALLLMLRRYFAAGSAGMGLGHLFAPGAGVAFAEHAPTGQGGEVLLPYQTYKRLRSRILRSAYASAVLLILLLIGLRTLPVPTAYLLGPALAALLLLGAYTGLSLLILVPRGQRLTAARTLVLADPRQAFAR